MKTEPVLVIARVVFDGTEVEVTKEQILEYWDREYPTEEGLSTDPVVQNTRQEVMLLAFATMARLTELVHFGEKGGTSFFRDEEGTC